MSGFGATLVARILSDQGRPVSNVTVSVQATIAVAAKGVAVQPQPYFANTDSQGVFSIVLPAAGTYSVCVELPAQQLLNSCEWNLSQSIVQVGTPVSAIPVITLITGIPLNIRLDDPTGILPKLGFSGSASVSFSILEAKGNSHLASLVSADNSGFNYRILVPLGASGLRLSALANNANVLNQQNATISASSIPQSVITDLTQVFHYQVVPLAAAVGASVP